MSARAPLRADGHPPVPQELKLKDEECERLSRVREQLERELEELTASLFEVRWPAGGGGSGGPGAGRLGGCGLLTPAFLPGSPQDGARSQYEAGGVRKAAEGGLGQGEPDTCPIPSDPARPRGRQGRAP